MAIRRYLFPLSLYGKCPAMSIVILSKGAPTYWCVRPQLLVLRSRLVAQESHCWHSLSTSPLMCNQW